MSLGPNFLLCNLAKGGPTHKVVTGSVIWNRFSILIQRSTILPRFREKSNENNVIYYWIVWLPFFYRGGNNAGLPSGPWGATRAHQPPCLVGFGKQNSIGKLKSWMQEKETRHPSIPSRNTSFLHSKSWIQLDVLWFQIKPRQKLVGKRKLIPSSDFLFEILKTRNFSPTWIKWMDLLVKGGSVGVNLNGEESSFFRPGKGLRQGDPISPFFLT